MSIVALFRPVYVSIDSPPAPFLVCVGGWLCVSANTQAVAGRTHRLCNPRHRRHRQTKEVLSLQIAGEQLQHF